MDPLYSRKINEQHNRKYPFTYERWGVVWGALGFGASPCVIISGMRLVLGHYGLFYYFFKTPKMEKCLKKSLTLKKVCFEKLTFWK